MVTSILMDDKPSHKIIFWYKNYIGSKLIMMLSDKQKTWNVSVSLIK
jgi:hypothetical protein